MPYIGRVVSLILLLPAFVFLCPDERFPPGPAAANAQGLIRNLIARLRGETMPDGIVKANGLTEAAQADISSRYPGRIMEISVKEGSNVTIGQKLARVSSPEADVTLVSPRDGEVQDLLAETEDTVAAGEPIATIVDLTDLNMTVFLAAADAGKLEVGDEARVILDGAPDYVIPAVVGFVASDRQVSPKAVETKDERAKQMFRVNLRIDPQVLKTYGGKVEIGLAGAGFVRTKPDAKWPPELQIKLPPAPVSQEASPAPIAQAEAQKPAASTASPVAQEPAPASAPATAPEAVGQQSRPASTPAPAVEAPKPGSAPAQAPVAVTGAPPPTPAPVRQEAPAPIAKAPAPVAESTASSAPVEQDLMAEFAPQSVKQLTGAWAPPAADCNKIFQRKGRALIYRQPADPFLKAVIVEPQRIRLPSATCELDSAVRDGGSLKLIAECASAISYTSRTVYVKLKSNDELVYSPTGDPVFATDLTKCPI
jgi:pyruvate/2-oxoglutarate dehydrogenase complex dihydrolipoamide acyltransferase (E2) component